MELRGITVWLVVSWVWHKLQPIESNADWPLLIEARAKRLVCRCGMSESREAAAKLTVSDEKSEAGLLVLKLFVRLVVSLGTGKNWHCQSLCPRSSVSSWRSLGNSSLVTPCSTL